MCEQQTQGKDGNTMGVMVSRFAMLQQVRSLSLSCKYSESETAICVLDYKRECGLWHAVLCVRSPVCLQLLFHSLLFLNFSYFQILNKYVYRNVPVLSTQQQQYEKYGHYNSWRNHYTTSPSDTQLIDHISSRLSSSLLLVCAECVQRDAFHNDSLRAHEERSGIVAQNGLSLQGCAICFVTLCNLLVLVLEFAHVKMHSCSYSYASSSALARAI